MTGSLAVRSSAGDVTGAGLRSSRVEVRVDAGTVNLRFDASPDRGTVQATAGRVVIEVPPGDRYRVQVETEVGVQQVDVLEDPEADRVIEVRATAGEVHVRYAS